MTSQPEPAADATLHSPDKSGPGTSAERQQLAPSLDSGQALRALDELVRAAHQWSLYGAEHPVAKQACDTAAAAFAEMVCERLHFTLTVVESGLLAEGEELPKRASLASLHQALRVRQIAAVTVHPEVTWDEVSALIRVLGTDSEELANRGGVRRALQEAGCQHIEVAEVDYSRFVPASQAEWFSAFAGAQIGIHSTVEGLVGACLELAGDRLRLAQGQAGSERRMPLPFPIPVVADPGEGEVEEIALGDEIAALHDVAPEDYVAVGLAWLVQASGEALLECAPEVRTEWRDAVAQRLGELDLSLQARIYRAPRQGGSHGPDLLAAIAAERSPEEIADLIVARPAAVVGEPSASLERILRRTLSDERKLVAVEPLLRARLMARGMSQDSVRNVVGLLLDQIAADMAMRVGGAIEWLGDFADAPPSVSGSVEDWPDLWSRIAPQAVAESRCRVLLAILPYEHEAARYLDLVGHLETAAAERAIAGDTGLVLEVVRALASEVDEDKPTRAPIAAGALQRLATAEVAQALRAALADTAQSERAAALAILAKMGNECSIVLLEEADREEDPQLRALAVRLLADAGERGASEVRRMLAQGSLDRVLSVAAALTDGREDRYLEHLGAGLTHRSSVVRLALAERLGRVPGLITEQLLIRALYDEEAAVQARAAESLGEIRARGAVHALALTASKGPLHGRRLEVRKAAVQALGKIGCAEAVPVLKDLLNKRSLLFRDRAGELSGLAAAALARIPGAQAQEALAACNATTPALATEGATPGSTRGRRRHG